MAMWQIEKKSFLPTFFEHGYLASQTTKTQFALCVLWYHTEGTMSKNVYLGLVFIL